MANPTFYQSYLVLFALVMICFGSESVISGNETTSKSKSTVDVGVVLDLSTPVGAMADVSMSMALSDFYALRPYYRTRLVLHTRDADDVVGAASAVVDLIKSERVQAIIGPQRTNQVMFAIELGEKAHVPIISFSATSPSISPDHSPYFIRAAQNDSSQVNGITAIIQGFNWHEIILIYEDTEYGNGIIPHLTDAFQEVDVLVPYKKAIPTSAKDYQITIELEKLMAMATRVILVHTSTPLGSRLFRLAHKAGMMSEGYAWLITDGLSNSIDEMDPKVIESMEGVLGLRPYVPKSKDLENVKFRWKRLFASMKPNSTATELNIFGLWAYDTVWALAMAVEKIGPMKNHFLKVKGSKSATELENMGISEIGSRLLDEMLKSKLKGLSGEFQLVHGNLQPSAFEILNVVGKGERIIGYWTPEKGLSRGLHSNRKVHYSTNTSEFKKIIWPGDSTEKPIGREKPTIKKKLRIGIPVKKGFQEFVKIVKNNDTSETDFQGFSIDMFRAALDKLPSRFEYQFITSTTDGKQTTDSYDQLLYGVYNNTYDAVVGDTTIVAHRWYVDFTLPYSDSGVSMVVRAKQERSKNLWIFIKPFSWDLWLAIFGASIATGAVLFKLERRRPPNQNMPRNFDMIFWFPFSALYYVEQNMDNRSKVVLVVWYFLTVILIQSYTASLSSILTLQSINPVITNPTQYYVGYQEGSFVKDLLINKLGFQESKLKAYSSPKEYHEALSKGSDNGGVAAIFDETPYIRIFLAEYCSQYMMVGTSYKTDGFGFAFPVGSPLVSYVSKAILNVTQGPEMDMIEHKYFRGSSCQDQATTAASNNYGLKARSFGGLFILAALSVAVILAFIRFWTGLEAIVGHCRRGLAAIVGGLAATVGHCRRGLAAIVGHCRRGLAACRRELEAIVGGLAAIVGHCRRGLAAWRRELEAIFPPPHHGGRVVEGGAPPPHHGGRVVEGGGEGIGEEMHPM